MTSYDLPIYPAGYLMPVPCTIYEAHDHRTTVIRNFVTYYLMYVCILFELKSAGELIFFATDYVEVFDRGSGSVPEALYPGR